jgi:hypothetical protein
LTVAAWSEEVDEVIGGDHVVMLVYATPAAGTVLLPVNNFGGRDREAGAISALNTSVGAWRKLERIRRDPKVAIAYHTRVHGETARPEYVLVQGRAALSEPVPDYPTTLGERWDRFEPWAPTPALWKRWQRIYALRVQIDVDVERVVVWPDLDCCGEPTVHGTPLPSQAAASQRTPAKGGGPRLDAERAASKAAQLPHSLLGWVGADGYPVAVPVQVVTGGPAGISLRAAPGLVPPGERRAGFTAHWFAARAIGQHQRKHTGWLTASQGGDQLLYAPHTQSIHRFPASRTLYRLVSGAAGRLGVRGARQAGFLR